MPARGQLWFLTRSYQAVGTDTRVVRINDDGTQQTIVANNIPSAPTAPIEMALDPAAGIYFIIANGVTSATPAQLLMGSIAGGAPSAVVNFPANYIVNAVQIDPIRHKLYVGVEQGQTADPATSGLRVYDYDPITHAVTGGALLVTAATDNKPVGSSGFDLFDPRDFDLDVASQTLFFTEELNAGVSEQGVYRLNLTAPTLITRMVSLAQFPDNHSTGVIHDVEVDPGLGRVYFSVTSIDAFDSAHANGYNAAQNNIWTVLSTASNATATKVTLIGLPGGAHFYPIDMVLDPVTHQIYVESEENGLSTGPGTDTDDVIYVFQLDAAGTSAALINTFSMSPAFANQADINGMAFDSLPVLTLADSAADPQQGGSAIALITDATITDVDGDHLASATVQITGGTFAGSTSSDHLTIAGAASGTVAGTSIAYSYDSATETLSLTGYDTFAHYEQALEAVRYNATGNATNSGANASRSVTWNVSDGLTAAGVNQGTTSFTVSVNQPPVAADHSASSNEDDTVQFSSAFLLGGATDPDGDTLTLAGVSNAAHGTVSYNSGTGIVTFIPTPNYVGAASFDFTISDGNGHTDVGTMALSLANVNDAPVLVDANVILSAENEDSPVPVGAVGTLISALIDFNPPATGLNNVSDVDAGASTGIALTAADTGHGSWFFSTDNGANWSAVGAVANGNALLLAADANTRLYFQPAANFNGTQPSVINFRAWDRTGGSNGAYADTTSNGGTSAFSTATDAASLVINPVNDSPTVSVGAPVNVDEQIAVRLVPAVVIGDVDLDAYNGGLGDYAGARLVANRGSGSNAQDQISLDPTGALFTISGGNLLSGGQVFASLLLGTGSINVLFNSSGTAATTALVNDVFQHLVYTNLSDSPDASFSFVYGLQDGAPGHGQGAGGATLTAQAVTVTVNPINDAPVLADANVVLVTQNEDSGAPSGAVGTLVSALVNLNPPSGGLDNVTDPDSAATGIALTAVDPHGSWFFSTDNGASWASVGAIANDHALLLAADANTRLYFRPDANFNGTLASAIGFRAWDQSSGSVGAYVDTAVNGGASAFSSATDTASLVINPVNDSPTVSTGAPINVDEQTPVRLLPAVAVGDADLDAYNGGLGDYAGARLVANRDSGSNAQDQLTLDPTGALFTISGGNLLSGGLVFASVIYGTGSINVLFNSSGTAATTALVNDVFHHLVYTNLSDNPDASFSFAYGLQDGAPGHGQGSGGATLTATSITVTVNPIDDAPVNGFPTSAAGIEDQTNPLTGVVLDPPPAWVTDVDSAELTSHLTVADGILAVSAIGATVTGSGSNDLTISGSPSAISATLQTLSYTPVADFSGTRVVTVVTSDGSLSDTDTITFAIAPVPDAPLGADRTLAAVEDVPLTVQTGDFDFSDADGDHFAGFLLTATPLHGKLLNLLGNGGVFVDGAPPPTPVELHAGDTVDAALIAGGFLRYAPDADYNGSDSFSFRVVDSSSQQLLDPVANTITLAIVAVNDAASITGGATGDVTEDGALADSDLLVVSDVDSGENQLQPIPAGTAGAQGHGSFQVLAGGQWTYTLNNADPAVQGLGVSGTLTDSITVSSQDGTATRQILVTIHGANDLATINGIGSGTVSEDGTLTVTESLSVSDADSGENRLVAIAAGTAGAQGHGTFEVLATGEWTYTLNNADSAVQALGANASLTDSIQVVSQDGSASRTIQVTIAGANDVAVIGGVSGGSTREDFTSPNLHAAGVMNISDTDSGEARFVTQSATLGSAGIGSFNLSALGTWSYSAVDNQVAIQQLAEGEIIVDSFVATSLDGSASRTVSVSISGANDRPSATTIGSDEASVSVTESNAPLAVSGTVTVVDPDLTDTVSGSVTSVLRGGSTAVLAGLSTLSGGLLGMLTLSPDPVDADAGDANNVTWTFDSGSDNFDFLGAGQSVSLLYNLHFTDGEGSGDDLLVRVAITGSNDAPIILSADAVTAIIAADPSSPLTGAGSFRFRDLDISDVHGAVVAAPRITTSVTVPAGFVPANGFGGLDATAEEDNGTTKTDGTVGWSYLSTGSAVRGLAAGETVTQVYAVSVTDPSGASATQDVTIVLTGTNDAPTLTAATDVTGALTEDAAVSDSGSFTFRDPDLSNAHAVTVSAPTLTTTAGLPVASLSPVGDLTATVAETLTDLSTAATVNWTFAVAPAQIQWLAANETLTQTYLLTVSDGDGGSFGQTVSVTITGTNDAPVIAATTDVQGAVAEDAAVTLTDGGSFVFRDLDLSNSHAVAVGPAAVTGSPTIPAGIVPATGFGMLTASVTETIGDLSDTGTIGWGFSVANAAVQALGEGETVTQVYAVTVTDSAGTSVTQDVTVTIAGANDGPTLVAATDVAGTAAEDAATPDLADSGSFTFADLDLSDAHAALVSAPLVTRSAGVPAGFVPAGGFGTLTASIAETLTDSGGQGLVNWTFSAANAAVQGLSAGETITQVYTITLSDRAGASFDQAVTITLTGANDAPTITAATDVTGGVLEHQSSPNLTDSGSFAFQDLDLSNSHQIVVGAPVVTRSSGVAAGVVPVGGLGTLSAAIVEDTTDLADTGAVGWTFSVADAAVQPLAKGETVTQVYTLTLSDGAGTSTTQDVTVTITGTNDAPVILATSDVLGSVVELADHAPGENVATLTDGGTIRFADADLNDVHGASFVAQGGAYLGTFTLGAIDQAGDNLGWGFSVSDAALNALGRGVVAKQYYDVAVDDGQGGIDVRTVEIELVGTNDAALLSSANVFLEQGASVVTASGTLAIIDEDNPALFIPQIGEAGRNGHFSIDAAGHWAFTANSAFSLGAGQFLSDVFTVLAADGTPTTVAVTITGHDAPAAARPDLFAAGEASILGAGLNLFLDNGAGADSDPDSPLRIVAVNGVAGNVGHSLLLASGARVIVNADGSFAYDTNHAFDGLTPAVGAANQFGHDSFTYTLAGGSTASVSVNIAGAESPGDLILGNSLDNVIFGLAGNDTFRLEQGGHDAVHGMAGNDGFYFGAALDDGDTIDGGAGTDTLAIQGNTHAHLDGMTNIEVVLALSGSDSRFGDLANNRYDYDLTTNDKDVAAGQTLTVQATGLLPGEDLRFDGSAEMDGSFRMFAGQGHDVLKGGAGSDGFFFGAEGNFTGADQVDGGGGFDSLALRGNYVGANAVLFTNTTISNIEVMAFLSGHSNEYSGQIVATGFDYDVTIADGNVAAGHWLDVNATRLAWDESARFDGRAETDGSFRILSGAGDDILFGGAGNDILYGGLGKDALEGGTGADTYFYRSAAESTSTGYDRITGFDWHVDRIDAPGGTRTLSQSATGELSLATFDDNLAAGLNGILGAGQAVLFTGNGGDLSGHVFAVIDANGVAGYQAGQDLVIELANAVLPIDPTAGVVI